MNNSEQKNKRIEIQIIEKQKIVDFDIKEFTLELLSDKYLNGLEYDQNEIFIPSYQRQFVWDNNRQSKFIESLLLGLPIPYIFTADTGDGRLEIVDGSQRLRTIVAFLANQLVLRNLEILTECIGLQYSDLQLSRQRKFKNTTIRMISLTDKSDEDVRFMMFERINTGSSILKDMEKRKGILGGRFIDFVYNDCSPNELFIKNTSFTKNMLVRGEPQELIIRFFAYSEGYKSVNSGVNEFLNEFTKEKNKYFPKDVYLQKWQRMLTYVDEFFPYGFKRSPDSLKTPRVRFDSISVGVHLALEANPDLTVQNLDWLESDEYSQIISRP